MNTDDLSNETDWTEYYVISIPLNSDGDGPEMDPEKVESIVYEVWDSVCVTYFVSYSLDEAKIACQKLNSK